MLSGLVSLSPTRPSREAAVDAQRVSRCIGSPTSSSLSSHVCHDCYFLRANQTLSPPHRLPTACYLQYRDGASRRTTAALLGRPAVSCVSHRSASASLCAGYCDDTGRHGCRLDGSAILWRRGGGTGIGGGSDVNVVSSHLCGGEYSHGWKCCVDDSSGPDSALRQWSWQF